MARIDGRDAHQLRPLSCEVAVVDSADGSARFNMGKTCVLAAVYGPVDIGVREERPDRATLTVNFSRKAKHQGVHDRMFERHVAQAVEAAIVARLHPQSELIITLQEIRDDGGLLACAINAACLALLDAGFPMSTCVASASCCTVAGAGTALLLDPVTQEAQESTARVTAAYTVSQQDASGVATLATIGEMTDEELSAALEIIEESAKAVTTFYRKTLERRASNVKHVV